MFEPLSEYYFLRIPTLTLKNPTLIFGALLVGNEAHKRNVGS